MTEYTPEKVAELIAEARRYDRASITLELAAALEAITAERNENGSCWDEGPVIRIPGECAPMPPRCELRAGHLGAHRGGRTEWMRNPSSYNQVARERDEALAVIADALRYSGRETDNGWAALATVRRILSLVTDKEQQ